MTIKSAINSQNLPDIQLMPDAVSMLRYGYGPAPHQDFCASAVPYVFFIAFAPARTRPMPALINFAMVSNGLLCTQPKEKMMKAFQAAFTSVMFAFASLLAPAAWAQSPADHIMVIPKELKWADIPSLPAGAKIAIIEGPLNEAIPFTFRLSFPANYKIPAHWHPAIEHVTVISGTFNMGIGDKLDPKQTQPLSAGSFAIMQPKTNHFAWTKQPTIVQVHGMGPWGINYVNPTDDPRKQ